MALLAGASLLAGCAMSGPGDDAIMQSQPYRLDSGDRLRVIVFEQSNLSNIFTVDNAGNLVMPLVGDVPARGKTTGELEGEIATRLRNGYVRDPDVAVEVDRYRPFFILGEVENAGQYPYVSGMTVREAAAIAGGFTPRARKWTVQVSRRVNGKITHQWLSLDDPVRPGDTISVKERLL